MLVSCPGGTGGNETQEVFLQDLLREEVISALPQRQAIPGPGDQHENHTAGHEVQLPQESEIPSQHKKNTNGKGREERADGSFRQRGQPEQGEQGERLPTSDLAAVIQGKEEQEWRPYTR